MPNLFLEVNHAFSLYLKIENRVLSAISNDEFSTAIIAVLIETLSVTIVPSCSHLLSNSIIQPF